MKLLFLNFLIGIHSLIKKTGVLEFPFFRKLFFRCYFFYKKHIEDPFHSLLRNHPQLLKGGNVFDVGANIGYTATLFSDFMDPQFKVFAFEPDLPNFSALRETIKDFGCSNKIIPVQAAVGDKNGTVAFWRNEKHNGDHRVLTTRYRETLKGSVPQVEVPLITLDTYVENNRIESNFRLIKIDVQGFELSVCRGMEKLMQMNPNALIAVEYMPSAITELGFKPEELLEFFETRDYFSYYISPKGKLISLQSQHLQGWLKSKGYVDVLFSKKLLTEASFSLN